MIPTIADVAREARVGIGTVSRVLNGSPLVAEATRQRVASAMERLGYRPSPIARAFGGRRTHSLEVLVPHVTQAFFFELLGGIEDGLVGSHYRFRIRVMADRAERDRVFDGCCVRGYADGALVVWMPPSDVLAERVMARRFPVVLLNATYCGLPSVGVDHAAAAAQAVSYCARLGHRRMALIDRLQDPFAAGGERVCEAGFCSAMADAQLPLRPEYRRLGGVNERDGAAAMAALLALEEPPTAVIVASAAQAAGAFFAARERGWRVPEDLSLVAYNDTEVTRFLGVTTVVLPLRELGRRASAALLASVADGDQRPTTTLLPTEVVVRKTCAPPVDR